MFAARVIFLAFMTWLLVVFVPSHQRGRITLGPVEEDGCCPPVVVEATDSCCAPETPATPGEPTAKQRANCAVCFWAAGLLQDIPVAFSMEFAERAYETAREYHAQVQAVACRLNHFGRDPPTSIL